MKLYSLAIVLICSATTFCMQKPLDDASQVVVAIGALKDQVQAQSSVAGAAEVIAQAEPAVERLVDQVIDDTAACGVSEQQRTACKKRTAVVGGVIAGAAGVTALLLHFLQPTSK